MVDAVIGGNIWNGKRIDAFKTAHVIAVLIWVRAALMVSVNAAVRAKIMLRGMRVELVELQVLSTFHDTDSIQRNRCNHSALAPADGAITAARVDDAIWEVKLQLNRATVAAQAMPGKNRDVADILDGHSWILREGGLCIFGTWACSRPRQEAAVYAQLRARNVGSFVGSE